MTPQNYYIIALTISSCALLFSACAFIVAFQNYKRKSGISFRGNFSIMSSIECSDNFVSGITLENLKDKSITIYGIYLKIDNIAYVTLENLDTTPLILKPYESYNKKYGPIMAYSASLSRVRINNLLEINSSKMRLVLATSEGKYTIPSPIKIWSPIIENLKNEKSRTVLISPITRRNNEKYIGENIKWVILLTMKNGQEKTMLIKKNDHNFSYLANLGFSESVLTSKKSIENHLDKIIKNQILPITSYVVHDHEITKEEIFSGFIGKEFELKNINTQKSKNITDFLRKFSKKESKS